MAAQEIATAIRRVESVFQRRPEAGVHVDAPAVARWVQNARVVVSHPAGMQVATDMPTELGGTGDHVTPGWLFRAGLASCASTSILMAAAVDGIALMSLEVDAGSQSDARGLLGMSESSGEPVYAGPFDVQLRVRIAADGVTPERLRTLVEAALRHSPIPNALSQATPVALHIEVCPV